MFNKTLTDIYVRVDLPSLVFYGQSKQQLDEANKRNANAIVELLRDHQSSSNYHIGVVEEHKNLCSFCGGEEERDPITKEPLCCCKALEEYDKEKQCLK